MKLLIRNGITTLHSEQETTEPATQRSVSIPQIYKHSYLTESTQSHALTWRGICFDPCCLSDPEQGFKYRASIQLNSVLFSIIHLCIDILVDVKILLRRHFRVTRASHAASSSPGPWERVCSYRRSMSVFVARGKQASRATSHHLHLHHSRLC